MKAARPRRPTRVCLLPFSRVSSHFVPSAPGTGPCPEPDLGLEFRGLRKWLWLLRRRELPQSTCRSESPGAPCQAFHVALFHKSPGVCLAMGGIFRLESNSALRGTSLWMWPQLEPGLDSRRVGAVPWVSPPPRPAPLGPSHWMQDTLRLPCPV